MGDVWMYALLAVSTLPPLVPNSALLVTVGVLAARGDLDIVLVLAVVAGSALLGDLLMRGLGRWFSDPAVSWMSRKPKRRALMEWVATRIQRYGIPFVIGVRFLPAGRIIGGLAAGVVRFPLRRYVLGATIAELVWATYSVGLGYLGSTAAGDSRFALLLGLGVSVVVAVVGGVVQWFVRRRSGGGSVLVRSSEVGSGAGSGSGVESESGSGDGVVGGLCSSLGRDG
ncbi:DedA family protein [Streptomyces sp. H27-D2]|uniref:DedA family protein n=1 Tax=Streptomyces sp. H27-D2 TaxID=3046304 RepID=UPI002DBCC3B6|nr:VTT domain-containing protein [Streptomyces sp. H27-D2]MEC4020098.1 VTT domain-containing protein [Streptomyces sp. H27-D2]